VSVEDFGASAAAFQLKEYLDLGKLNPLTH